MELITFYFVCVGIAIILGVGRLFLSDDSYSLTDMIGYTIFSIVPVVNILLSIMMIIDWSGKLSKRIWDGKSKRFVEEE